MLKDIIAIFITIALFAGSIILWCNSQYLLAPIVLLATLLFSCWYEQRRNENKADKSPEK